MCKKTGIYCYTNKLNGKKYVGQSINIDDRILQHKHRYNIKSDSGYNGAFHKALREFGLDNFEIKILEICKEDELDFREIYWIDHLNTVVPNGYNIRLGGRKFQKKGEKKVIKTICPICGKEKYKNAKMCLSCKKKKMHENAILKDADINIDLIDRILSSSLEKVSRELGYNGGNGLKKRLRWAGYPCNRESMLKYFFETKGYKHPSEVEKELKLKLKKCNKENSAPKKKVAQYDLNGVLINTFESRQDAYHKTGISSGHISDCCNGKRKKASGFIWKYID